jgi:hypothetical protein
MLEYNGRHIPDIEDRDAVLEFAESIPSGLSDRTAPPRPQHIYRHPAAPIMRENGIREHALAKNHDNPSLLSLAAQYFDQAARFCVMADDQLGQAHCLVDFGVLMRLQGKPKEAINAWKIAANIYKSKDHLDQESDLLGMIYTETLALANGTKGEEQNKWKTELRPLQRRCLEIFEINEGNECDKDAYRVEQNEMGIAKDKNMGIDHVYTCIGIGLWDPKTTMAAIAHVDEGTIINSLDIAFDEFNLASTDSLEKKRSNTNLPYIEARIFGASYNKKSTNKKNYKQAADNVYKLIKYLCNRNDVHVNLLSADIFNPDQPSSFTIQKGTFKLSSKWPGRANPNAHLHSASIGLLGPAPLQIAFTPAEPNKRSAVYLSRAMVHQLRESRVTETELQTCNRLAEFNLSEWQLPVRIEEELLLKEAYLQQIKNLTAELKKGITQLQTKHSFILPRSLHLALLQAVSRCPLYIGDGADKKNQPFLDLITNKVFKEEIEAIDDLKKKIFSMDISQVEQFEFPKERSQGQKKATQPATFSGNKLNAFRKTLPSPTSYRGQETGQLTAASAASGILGHRPR